MEVGAPAVMDSTGDNMAMEVRVDMDDGQHGGQGQHGTHGHGKETKFASFIATKLILFHLPLGH